MEWDNPTMTTMPDWLKKSKAAPVPADDAPEGREESHHKQPVDGLRLELSNRNCVSVKYAAIVGAAYFNPSFGIQFVFEGLHPAGWNRWKQGLWMVTISGHDLKAIYDHICLAKEVFVREGENVTAIRVEALDLARPAEAGLER